MPNHPKLAQKMEFISNWVRDEPELMRTISALPRDMLLSFIAAFRITTATDISAVNEELSYIETWDGKADSLADDDLLYYILQLENYGFLEAPSIWVFVDGDDDQEDE